MHVKPLIRYFGLTINFHSQFRPALHSTRALKSPMWIEVDMAYYITVVLQVTAAHYALTQSTMLRLTLPSRGSNGSATTVYI